MIHLGKLHEVHLRCFSSQIVEGGAEGWQAQLRDSVAGIAAACWAPDSRQILTYSDSFLRLSVWSLVTLNPAAYIMNPKMLPPKGLAFTGNKKFAAIAERKDAKDVIGIYYAGNDWKMVSQIEVDTYDLQDVKWVGGDSSILAWDSPLECKIVIYSAYTGDRLTEYKPDVVGLGIKSLTVSPDGNTLAAGLFDGNIFLYNNLTC